MIKPYWNDRLKEWDIMDTETGEIILLHDDKLDGSACKDYCDFQNSRSNGTNRGPDL